MRSARVMDLIEALYTCRDTDVRHRALLAASCRKGRKANDFLSRIATTEIDIPLKSHAAFLLGLMGERHFGTLKKLALNQREHERVRDNAADALGDMLDFAERKRIYAEGVQVLVQVLSDPSPQVRWTACFSLGKIKAKAAAEHLRRLAETDTSMAEYGSVAGQAAQSADYIEGKTDVLDMRDLRVHP